ncbi:TraB/GumN family protein [Flavilitoribacter nigricans]|uniref:TraB/GumN family protein n=1 Tax=Flavilitoribacter nigricans (strain ATCC 23147 / DSM 23189 / NBRC 102662 / NCIMB 1420 / SS-2) TaxID=1122177 RepID=A0A2D0N4R1_FLAN2|nr:TraB/GumN family protein [Flavilitoribacter nigricans]PHN03366.1 hypothetical protein CRP01_27160 [Flavilitoribacter nigricans DSM 23189 = NBRC 102662]
MKYLSLILLQFAFIASIYSQNAGERQSMLWEISGNGLPANSYLYGSAHLNDRRIFDFGDSLYFALSSCEQFAGEINFQQIDTFLIKILAKSFMAGVEGEDEAETDTTEENASSEDSNIFDEMDMYGKPTVVDCYLFRTAMNLGLSSHGLEDMSEHVSILDGIPEKEEKFKIDDPWYEEFINTYARGDVDKLREMTEPKVYDEADVYRMSERNLIQATSFEALAKRAGTFAVVGAAHLFGKDNVLDQLAAAGYRVRRVNFGQSTDRIDRTYLLHQAQDWYQLDGSLLRFSLQSSLNNELVPLYDQGEVHMATEFDKGLIYMTMIFPIALLEDETAFLEYAKAAVFPDTLNLNLIKTELGDTLTRYDIENFSEKNAYRARLQITEDAFSLQMILGLSISAFDHPNVERYLNGLVIYPQEKPVEKKWNRQFSADGAFEYYFPDDIAFSDNPVTNEHYAERGDILLRYKVYEDPQTEDEYMVRYHCMPPGITYVEPYSDLRATMESLGSIYNAKVSEEKFITKDEHLGMDAILVDRFDNHFYVREIIRGAMLYIWVQKSPSHEVNEDFFENIAFSEPKYNVPNTFTFPDARFSMKAPAANYQYQTTEEEQRVENFDFNYTGSGVTLMLEFEPYGKYQELNLSDSIFTLDNAVDRELTDTILEFKTFKYGDVCPAYIVRYQNDSTFYYRTVMGIFCNHTFTSLELVAPQPLQTSSYVDDLLGTIRFELDEDSGTSLTSRKAPLILQDLESKDSLTFSNALQAFNNYENFTEADLPLVYPLLWKPLLNEIDEYNAKYILVAMLHNFESEEVEDELVKYYSATDNGNVKAIILESLGQRSSPTSMPKMIGLMKQMESPQQLSSDLFKPFADSLELMQQYYPQLKKLAEKDIGTSEVLALIAHWLEQETNYPFLENDLAWYHPRMYARIDSFYVTLEADSTASIDGYLMDYIREKGDRETAEKLYEVISGSTDIFGKYRVIYNRIAKDEPLPQALMDTVMESSYYRYWILKGLSTFDRELPDRWNDKEKVAEAVMKYHFFSNYDYWCEDCTLVREILANEVKPGNMVFMKCASEEEGAYYLGCIGPFDENGHIDLNNDQSVYYTSTKTEAEFETIFTEFIEYINSKE